VLIFSEIYKSYLSCRKGKSKSRGKFEFELKLIENLWDLLNEINSGNYQISKYLCFFAQSPKQREIFAPSFRDRIVHHLVAPYLEAIFEPLSIYDVYNNRKGKGTHKAVERGKSFSRAIGLNGWYLQLDVKSFFYSINKNILYQLIINQLDRFKPVGSLTKDEFLSIIKIIIYEKPTENYIFKGDKEVFKTLKEGKSLFTINDGYGLPIGNLTSQYFANIYLYQFDNWIKRELKVKYYIRYVDDFVLFSKDRNKLRLWFRYIERYLREKLELSLRDDVKLRQTKDGLDFLGYIIRPDYILSRRRVINNYKWKKSNNENSKNFLQVQASFVGHLKHCNCHKLMVKEFYPEL
jgi:hypothetical protein